MFRRWRGPQGPVRGVVIVAVAVALGTAVLIAGRDRSEGGTARLAATQTSLRADHPAPTAADPTATVSTTAVSTATATASAVAGVDPPAGGPTTSASAAVAGAGAAATPPAAPAGTGPATTSGTTPSTSDPGTAAPASSTTVPATTTTAAPTTTTTSTTTTTTAPAAPGSAPSVAADVVPLTNADRTSAGLVTLARDACLDTAAAKNAEAMARSGVLAHDPGSGSAVLACHPGATWGDNIGTDRPCSASYLEPQWMASLPHRENILNPVFRSIGVAAWTDPQGGCWIQVLFSS